MADLEEAWRIAGEGGPVCNQVLYHLRERAIEHAVIPWCEAHGVAVVGYSPFGHGRFPGPRTAGGRVLEEIAAAHGATPRQVVLRFLVRRPSLFTIPKASSPEHAEENARAGELHLTDREVAHDRPAFPRGAAPAHAPGAVATGLLTCPTHDSFVVRPAAPPTGSRRRRSPGGSRRGAGVARHRSSPTPGP